MDRLKLAVVVFCIGTVHSVEQPHKTFRCRNGTYIEDRLICDGKVDCVESGDGLDEIFGSCGGNREDCGPGSYQCTGISYFTNACRNATTRCNTIPNCLMYDDKADEDDCGDEVNVEGCTLDKGKYLCSDGLRCLDIGNTCDGFCNCFDCSDEAIGCLVGDEGRNSSQQACFKTPNGPFCCSKYDDFLCKQCNSSNICDQKCVQFANQSKCFCEEKHIGVAGTNNAKCQMSNAVEENVENAAVKTSHQACFNSTNGQHCCSKYDSECQECNSDDICDQKCFKFANEKACICEENYSGIPGTRNAYCSPRFDAAKEKILVYSTAHAIKAINLFTRKNATLNRIFEEECEPFLLTGARNFVYFVTVKTFGCSSVSIYRTSLTDLKTEEIIKIGNDDVTSLAVDWITNNIYYSTIQSLFVCSSRGEYCKNLASGEIYFINLAPRFGLMFWVSRTEDSEGRSICTLMKSAMDGSDQKSLLSIYGPCNAMWTVDESAERIYWFDYNVEELQSVKFSGEKRTSSSFQLQLFSGTVEFRGTPHHNILDQNLVNNTKMQLGTMFENDLYFLINDQKGIWGLQKGSETFSKHYPLPKITDSDAIYDVTQTKSILVFNPALHRTEKENPCPGCCKELCLPHPSTSKSGLSYGCFKDANSTAVACDRSVSSTTKTTMISVWALISVVLWTCMVA